MGYVQAVLGNKNVLVQFEDGRKKDMSSCSLVYVFLKEETCPDMDKSISNLPKNNKLN